jgi:DDE superfamily endonuclease
LFTLIVFKAPAHGGSTHYNYKNTHSIILLAVCDANYRFTYVDIGAPGRRSDGGVFKSSSLYERLEGNNLDLPEPSVITDRESDPKVPYFFIGDAAFPLAK